ncbi:DUF368 domain-containing protein [Pueribacillus sp. YX66]|uniref:DUF368 domain-containing protein n=1 Tax=Pueribacillus sp. YX66 TaxID=3229242 RepID=UPI00358D8D20
MEWRNLYRGLLMGITDLIPGVSGGTVAFLLGIYDRLLHAISGFFSRNWKKHIGFLFPLVIGIGAALLLFSSLIDYLLDNHFEPTQFFFMGLIIGVIPFIMKQADIKRNFRLNHFITMLIFAVLLASLDFVKPDTASVPITMLSLPTVMGLFFSGWAASMAMLLPGISGSFILLILGVHTTAINALSTLNLPIIAVIGSGVVVGFIVSSKGIRYILDRYPAMTYAMIIGLILGSIFVVFPGMPGGNNIVISVAMFIIGLLFSFLFSKIGE